MSLKDHFEVTKDGVAQSLQMESMLRLI